MSDIDELKLGVEVHGDDAQDRVSMISPRAGKHKFIDPSESIARRANAPKQQVEDNSVVIGNEEYTPIAEERTDIDYSTLPNSEPDPNIKRSPVDDLLGDKFEDYKKRKAQEMQQWSAEKIAEEEECIDHLKRLKGEDTEEDEEGEMGYESSLEDDDYLSDDDTSFAQDEDFGDDYSLDDDTNSEETVKETAPVQSFETADNIEVHNTIDEDDTDIIDEDDETDEEDEQERDEILKRLKEQATEKLKPISKKLDISSFTVIKKPAANSKTLNQQTAKAAKWIAPAQNSVIMMKEYSGSELEALREYSESARSFAMQNRKFKSIYDHLVSKKPATYESWAKSTPYSDVDHYFFATYIASFKGANFLPADCDGKGGCGNAFLSDDIDIMSMVKYKDDKAKHKFVELYQSELENSNPKGLYVSEIVPVSNEIAIGFKNPSIYNVIEITTLSDQYRDKFVHILDFVPYIDAIYIIDMETQSLVPVRYKIFANNPNKTTISKLKAYYKALNTLTIDEFGTIKAYIRSISDLVNSGISYVYPSIVCPKCGAVIEEKPATAEELVFTRYQLGALVNTSLK